MALLIVSLKVIVEEKNNSNNQKETAVKAMAGKPKMVELTGSE